MNNTKTPARYRVGIDTGGTFTDFVSIDEESGTLTITKTSSTPQNPIDGVVNSIDESTITNETDAVSQLIHGTTVTTNALIERTGAEIGYITTDGFTDVPFIQRINRKDHYDLRWDKPEPLVERKNCHGITERVNYKGEVLEPLDEAGLRETVRELSEQGIDTYAVIFLFSYVNPEHEQRTQEIIFDENPDATVSLSHQVYSKWREYERASTTLADSYLKPDMQSYIDEFEHRMDDRDITNTAIMKSNGGVMFPDAARQNPVHTITSGPAGGVVSARYFGSSFGFDDMVSIDMGGTSCDLSILTDGEQNYTTNFELEFGLPINVPMIDIATIGAGGGSIAWIDEGGLLNVGPRSAGAQPGPACYGRGGTNPAVTDAHLVLGRLNPDFFLGGKLDLDEEAAYKTLEELGDKIEMSAEEAAASVLQITNNNMYNALSAELVERGHDPQQFAMVSFGGAGPLHAAELARKSGISNIVVPVHPGVASATGLVMADGRVDYEQTMAMRSDQYDLEQIENLFESLTRRAITDLEQEGFDGETDVTMAMGMRYLGQNYEIEVPVGFDEVTEQNLTELFDWFHQRHEHLYGFQNTDEVIEIISFKATAQQPRQSPPLEELPERDSTAKETREVYFEETGNVVTDIYDRDELGQNAVADGPAIIEDTDATTVVPPSATFETDTYGNILIELEDDR
ncbi:hydantoinase/oxoprolinase family protein [Halalkalicoccus jeotgali]|uniref:Hydantoin utilization protein n=1 Tax=Halalkalicoccus jeotgali (strain DSM 18796 / CECT 7217 / JCM 14584 / KCTC 4019 / B3) TaxID=795797 RepID=D8JCD9_HALJB|nr:hydantoinase/oxoprolinase family protein [Halalkalicoccus jeotgali]ADJ17046.1 hydantoin utilization protein [Halalkalicoccus jeotgali B3]ELY38789.1 hydantoin utilization protein [Halalkalicoccus jeotgali B3]